MEQQTRLNYLLNKLVAHEASDNELNELETLVKTDLPDVSIQQVEQLLEQQEYKAVPFDQQKWQKVADIILASDKIRSGLQASPVHRVHFLKTAWFRYAAAIVMLLGVGSYLWFSNKKTPLATTNDNKQLQSDIAPGSNKAILTIGSNKIDLASNKTGIAVSNAITYNDGEKIVGSSPVVPAGDLLQLATPRGGQYQAELPDGSKVWLNAASSIKFPSKFSGDKREVEITGEVYLEIAPVRLHSGSRQPFMVKVNGTEIQVLGTSLNINAYEDESSVKTTLIEGSVKVSNGINQAILKPGQQASTAGNTQGVKVNDNADIDQVLAWKNGLFNFNGASLKEVMNQLKRWYNLEIVYQASVNDKEFAGKIQRDLNLSEVLELLSGAGIRYRIEEGRRLILLP